MIYQVDPSDGSVLHEIKAPGLRVHGIAFDEDGNLWSADTASGVVSLLDVSDGRVLNYIRVPWPTEVHGLTIDSAGKLWYCDAETTAVGILGR
jgi:sugar lactone lactonase YvrE